MSLGQLGQHLRIDLIVAKRRLVLLQPQAPQPRRNVHAALPVVEPFSLVGFRLTPSAAGGVLFLIDRPRTRRQRRHKNHG